ncbi:MAG: lanthionine synthetase LanC family protein [Bacteroidales bacterium]|nr:lanthionine synthetase LanC family protein [Bacteroidales bacterium]
MKNLKDQNLLFKQRVDERLRRIGNVLLLNASFIDNPGLLNGKMGIAIFFYQYSRYTGNKIYGDYAGELIDEIYEEINTNTPVDFTNGLTGIGWGIEYLVKNRFVDADTDEALADFENAIYRNLLSSPLLLDNGNDLFGYGLYCISRLHGHERDDDNLNTLIKKEHLIYLTDECERLLIHKRYLEFNILQLSTDTINSILWFLLEMEKLRIFPSKVKRILKFLPDYITLEQDENINISNSYILNNLAKAVAENVSDNNLQNQYHAISKKINGVAFDPLLDEKALFGTLQSINIQKMINQPYINSSVSTIELFEKAFKLIDNEEEWNRILDGLNKSNLGLMGLAGTGLYLVDELSLRHSRNVNPKKSAITAR